MKRSRMEEESTKAERVGGNVALPRRELLKGGIALTGALSMGVGFNSIGAAARAEPDSSAAVRSITQARSRAFWMQQVKQRRSRLTESEMEKTFY